MILSLLAANSFITILLATETLPYPGVGKEGTKAPVPLGIRAEVMLVDCAPKVI